MPRETRRWRNIGQCLPFVEFPAVRGLEECRVTVEERVNQSPIIEQVNVGIDIVVGVTLQVGNRRGAVAL